MQVTSTFGRRMRWNARFVCRRARKLIEDAFAPAQVQITRTLASEPQRVAGRDRRLEMISGTSLSGIVELTEGEAPEAGRRSPSKPGCIPEPLPNGM